MDRGKNGSKHHVIVEAHGIPLATRLTGGNRNDVTQLIPLIEAVPRSAVRSRDLADGIRQVRVGASGHAYARTNKVQRSVDDPGYIIIDLAFDTVAAEKFRGIPEQAVCSTSTNAPALA